MDSIKLLFECLRWGPTSLQTVKLNEYEVFTVCTMFGAENKSFILFIV